MPALPAAPSPNLVDDVEPAPRTQVVLEPAPSAAQIDGRSAPRLITEHEVAFSTAAAVPMPSTRWWTGATRVVAVAMRRIVRISADSRPKRRHYPPRNTWPEDSRGTRNASTLTNPPIDQHTHNRPRQPAAA
jgi:hypothetical protein